MTGTLPSLTATRLECDVLFDGRPSTLIVQRSWLQRHVWHAEVELGALDYSGTVCLTSAGWEPAAKTTGTTVSFRSPEETVAGALATTEVTT